MKVVQINSECGKGSTGKIVTAISDLLFEKGIENYIFYSGNHKSTYHRGIMIQKKAGIRIHQILSRVFGDQGFHSYFSTLRLIKMIKKINPDVILMHNLHGYYLHLGVLFCYLKKFDGKVFWTLHDCWAFTGHCTHFTIEKCDRWKKECGNCPQIHKYPYSWFFDRSKKLYQKKKKLFLSVKDMTIITPSEWLSGLVKESFLSEYPCKVINNGIDIEIFKPTKNDFKVKHSIENKKMVLGVASVWSYEKGLDVFINLAQKLDDSKYKIVMVGTDDSIDKQLPKNIISIHRTNNQKELAEIYSAADVFLNPTREDNYPSVNMEAIACGTKVVAFDTGGCQEILSNFNGTIIKDKSLENVIKAIVAVTSDLQDGERHTKDLHQFDQKICFEKYAEFMCN